MRVLFFLVFVLLHSTKGNTQHQYDAHWILGQDAEIKMDFNSEPVNISLGEDVSSFSMAGSNISMSDSSGNLLFYSNGCEIRDRTNSIMLNGDMINPGAVEQWYCNSGGSDSPIPQGIVCLPLPEHSDIYYLFYLDLDEVNYHDTLFTFDPKRLYYSIVDMGLNEGLGGVNLKSEIAIEDTLALARGQLTAVKHGNGRDWWVIIPKALSNCYYLLQLSPEGIIENKLECVGEEWEQRHGIGQAVFSPNGEKFARFNPWNGLHIFDFDRCEGVLSNPVSIDFPEDTFSAAGLSISPNSRFLYTATTEKLYQFDLNADPILDSRLLIDTIDAINFPTFGAVFYLSQLAPDGKIYIAGISSHFFLHVINEPDSMGTACNFIQQGVDLPALNFASIPNFPNYRLNTVLEECDTIVSSSEYFSVQEFLELNIFPNPTSNFLNLEFSGDLKPKSGQVHIFDNLGRLVKQIPSEQLRGSISISIKEWESGIYWLQYLENGITIISKSFLVE
ncbi:MAG: T9SS type A sorting domain-containing protein [Chitinophagales bacterium]|nr:T9SS type A sorting domain-containing protein [Chitinophagales bacterium]